MAEIVPLATNFDLGFQSDVSRDELNARAAFRMKDWVMQDEAPLRRRGGWDYASQDVNAIGGSSTSIATIGWLPFPNDGHLLSVGNTGSVYQLKRFDAVGGVLIADSGDTSIVPSWPVFWHKTGSTYDGIILPGFTQGAKVPKKYYDTGSLAYTVSALGGTPPRARCGFSWGDYLVLFNYYDPTDSNVLKNYRAAWSDVGNPDSWTLSGANASTFDFPEEIVGAVPVLNAILFFGYGDCHLLTGDSPPPGGNFARKTLFAGKGTFDGRSCVPYRNYAIWANAAGVWQSDGATLTDLTASGGISLYYRSVMSGFAFSQGWSAIGGILLDHYILTIRNASGALVTTLVCDIERKAWKEWTNIPSAMFAHRSAGPGTSFFGGDEELFFAHATQPRVCKLSSLWTPTLTNASDADGAAVQPVLETGYMRIGSLDEKRIRRIFLGYDLRTAGGGPTLALSYVLTPETGAAYTSMGSLPVTTQYTRKKMRLGRHGLGFGLKIAQVGASADTRLYSIEGEAHPWEQMR